MGGEVVCTTRRNWKRVYDLPERALPAEVLGQEPTDEECFTYLIRSAGRALGVGTRRDIADYYRLMWKALGRPEGAERLLDAAIFESGLRPARVEGWDEPAFVDPAALSRGDSQAAHRTTLLSPFDSLIWERRRTERLFGFTLSLEAYKPKEQRIHGYFTMPLLAGGRLVGRVDPARDGRTLVARRVSLDDSSAVEALVSALREAASWVGCDAVRVEEVQPRGIARSVRKALS